VISHIAPVSCLMMTTDPARMMLTGPIANVLFSMWRIFIRF